MNKSNLDFDKQLCYCTCLPEMFKCSEVLNSGIKTVLPEFFFKMQFVKNVLVYVFGVFTFSFVTLFMKVLSIKLF